MEIGVCLSASDQATALAASTVAYVEDNVQQLLGPGDEPAFAARLAAAQRCARPISAANCFLSGALRSTGPDVDLAAVLAWASTVFARAQRAGIATIVFGSGGARHLPEGFPVQRGVEQFVGLLRTLGPLAADHDITLVVEPLNRSECNFINTLAEGAAVVRAVGHPQVRLVADLFHMARNGEVPADLAAEMKLVHHVHVAEVTTRSAPGVAGDDFRPWLRILRAARYTGAMSLECGWGNVAAELDPALAVIRQQWNETA